MKKVLLLAATTFMASTIYATQPTHQLDLSDNSLTFDTNEVWDGIYNNENLCADGFVFSHTAPYGPGYYEGFIASRNTDTKNHYDAPGWTANQWGCMAKGGVDPKSEQSYNAEAIEGKPFLINYYSAYSFASSQYGASYITLEDNATYIPQGIYVCNSPWGYYGCTEGDGFAQPLAQEGGYYKITFNGVNIKAETTKSVDFYLAERQYSDRNSDGLINEGDNFTLDHWAWCDLSELGEIDVLYITMDSSDKGEYGMNTAAIVCMDGLSVVKQSGSVSNISTPTNRIYAANGDLYITLPDAQTIALYTTTGTLACNATLSAGSHVLDLRHLQPGIYFVRHNNGCNKIILQ